MAKNSYSDMTELIKDYYAMSVGNYLNQSISINNVTLSCDIYKVEAETELTPSILTGCTEADANTQIIIGRDMSIASETTFIPPYRCKGIIIGDVGTFTNEGTISMTARGASGEGKNIQLTPDYMISAVGGAGASARARTIEYYNTGYNGDAGSAPTAGILSCGGGGSGAVTGSPGTYYTGAGGNGTSFSGGAGGGATVDSNGNAGSSTGGAGGNGKSGDSSGLIRGGAGNPKGTDSGSQTGSADSYGEGTGGLIVILARKLISSGSLTSNGSKAPGFTSGGSGRSNWAGGGASGGGCIVLISAENEVTSLTSVTGGAAGSHSGSWQKDGGAGGSGAYANITVEDLILVDLPVEFAITDESHQSRITPSEAVRYLGLMDKDEFYYEIMGSRHRAMDTDMSFEDFDLPTGKVPSGHGNPVGTIINFFGESAPDGYLACDGTAYNIADYPTLAAHLLSFTDPTPYEVDGDDTKFKVPDLRGEFLRGSGTNSHTDQGSGANVGVHQDGTIIPHAQFSTSGYMDLPSTSDAHVINPDTSTSASSRYYLQGTATQASMTESYTSRPTNTSILYCIKY